VDGYPCDDAQTDCRTGFEWAYDSDEKNEGANYEKPRTEQAANYKPYHAIPPFLVVKEVGGVTIHLLLCRTPPQHIKDYRYTEPGAELAYIRPTQMPWGGRTTAGSSPVNRKRHRRQMFPTK